MNEVAKFNELTVRHAFQARAIQRIHKLWDDSKIPLTRLLNT